MTDQEINFAVLNHDTMRLRYAGVYRILTLNGLQHYLSYFDAENPSHDLPYHNRYHSYCMVLNCYEGARFENVAGEDLRALLVAALFHDFDHSGGKFEDGFNIRHAVNGLWAAHYHINSMLLPVPQVRVGDEYAVLSLQELEKAFDTIKITKYPYEADPVTLIQKIIRDADLMQVYEASDEKLRKQFSGLKEEVEILQGRTFTTEEWANGCADFNRKVVWHTHWAIRKARVKDHAACSERLKQLLLEHR